MDNIDARSLLEQLCQGQRRWLIRRGAGSFHAEFMERPTGILCGSFNPLHEGHLRLRKIAEQLLGGPVWFELTVVNADKPPLDVPTVSSRSRQFRGHNALLTNAATFVEKASEFPNTVFVVGFDTAIRILEPRFYGDSIPQMESAMRRIHNAGCSFLVAGRHHRGGFGTLQTLDIPMEFRSIFREISESDFRIDISSTELRNRQAADTDAE
ncbi:nucleotidyl transferase family protein [Thalassoroseus pseudoceratinae]|uniref:hypothetical protein n=1 Tax=Thalassoroseus pseudoceratinae TaxID=2713176 RepID=UPI001422DD5C|nr:hypothetical protein [Thalassoroseus pseudoceratinae]